MDRGTSTYTPDFAVVVDASKHLIQDAHFAPSPFNVVLKDDTVLSLRRTMLFQAARLCHV